MGAKDSRPSTYTKAQAPETKVQVKSTTTYTSQKNEDGNMDSKSSTESDTKSQVTSQPGTEVQVKPMLTTSQKNFKDVPHPESILSGEGRPGVTREDLTVPGAQCFLLHGLLSESECAHYIAETEKIGYSGLSDVFPADYRSNDRVLSICDPLVNELWKRIEPWMTRKEVIRVRPIGFGNEGTWKPFRLNECCKFGKYTCGGHFSPHIDGPWIPREDESSIFTVVIYLNSNFDGGATKFLCKEDTSKVICTVTPKTGSALIFNHDTMHEGEPVTLGTKYIIRTEIMYRRVDTEMLPDPEAYQQEENYLKTLTLYQKSFHLEQEGDVKGFTDTYLQAIQLQRQAQRSISTESGNDLFFPHEIYLRIFGFLTPKDLCRCMRVCKSWYDIAMDGQLWYDHYQRNWPVGILLETTDNRHAPALKLTDERPFLRDWYGHFKQITLMKHVPQKVAVLDLGSFSFKCAALHLTQSTIRKSSIESVVAIIRGVFDLHIRRTYYNRYYCGQYAKKKYPKKIVNIVAKREVVNPQMLPEIVTGLFVDCRVRPKYTPVIILEPPGLWTDKMREEVAYIFLNIFLNPSVCFLSTAVATLCSLDLQSGVVVDVGHSVATCAVVWNRELLYSESCPHRKAKPDKLAHMVENLIMQCLSDEVQVSVLKENIVLTGGNACSADLLLMELRKQDSSYAARSTDDSQYAAVMGGCNVANLCFFRNTTQIDKDHTKTIHDGFFTRSRPGSHFYIYCMKDYWCRFLNGSKNTVMEHCCRDVDYRSIEQKQQDWYHDVTEEELFHSDTD